MPDGLLGILKLCLLALLYLFFARVLWAVWRELHPSEPLTDATVIAAPHAPAKRPTRSERRKSHELVVISGPAGGGERFTLADEMTVGRAPGCHVSINDTFASQLHARLFRSDGVVMVEDLGSTNGTYVNEAPVTSPVPLRAGDHLRIGETTLELR